MLQALGLLLPLAVFAFRGWGGAVGQVLAFTICVLLAGLQLWRWQQLQKRTTQTAVARHLNRKYPSLEESAELLLQPEEELSLLAKLQKQRTEEQLGQISIPEAAAVSFLSGWTVFAAGVGLAAILWTLPDFGLAESNSASTISTVSSDVNKPVAAPKAVLPAIEQMHLRISPPQYTRKARYAVTTPSFKVEAGAKVSWTIQTSQPVTSPQLELAGQKAVQLQPVQGQVNTYTASITATQSALYQIKLNGQASEFYSIEVIPDEAPAISVQTPKQYTEVLFGEPQRVRVQAVLQDDYGLKAADLVATVAKGEGEAVKFREQRIPLKLSFTGQPKQLQLNQTLDLQALGMTYGDELYFYLQAWDNHRGYTRTEAYFVQLEDTTVVELMDDLSLGVNPNPEYFRSQRQIIIDTEKLIKEQPKQSKADLMERSNNIGVDQKLLRLRYGKFLGEEFESNLGTAGLPEELTGHHADDGHDHSQDQLPSQSEYEARMNALLDPYLHKHDQEEAATFFEPAIKAQLKGALAQMWEAELRLRTGKPKEALPFELKALRLLKEVQQKSRVYVKKTGFEPPPLKIPEKRLTGDLSKVHAPALRREEMPITSYPAVRQAMQRVAQLRQGQRTTQADAALLEQAGQTLGKAAVEQPVVYLRALQDLKQVVEAIRRNKKHLCADCLTRIEAAFHRFLPVSEKTARKQPASGTENTLAKDYFNRIN